jgi:hypothetical protein
MHITNSSISFPGSSRNWTEQAVRVIPATRPQDQRGFLPTIAHDALAVPQDDPTGGPALNGSPVEGFRPLVILNVDDMLDDVAAPDIPNIDAKLEMGFGRHRLCGRLGR